jgi:hypothetical protein
MGLAIVVAVFDPKVAVVDVAIAIDGTCDSRGCIGPEGSGRGRCYSN